MNMRRWLAAVNLDLGPEAFETWQPRDSGSKGTKAVQIVTAVMQLCVWQVMESDFPSQCGKCCSSSTAC
jgi:hypothetical protein